MAISGCPSLSKKAATLNQQHLMSGAPSRLQITARWLVAILTTICQVFFVDFWVVPEASLPSLIFWEVAANNGNRTLGLYRCRLPAVHLLVFFDFGVNFLICMLTHTAINIPPSHRLPDLPACVHPTLQAQSIDRLAPIKSRQDIRELAQISKGSPCHLMFRIKWTGQ